MKLKTLEFFTELSSFPSKRIFGGENRGQLISEALQTEVFPSGLTPREAAQLDGEKNFGQLVKDFVQE